MHPSAMHFGDKFFKTYFDKTANITIVDIGSHDMNGSLRTVAPLGSKFIGLDFVNGNGVDIVIKDAYSLPLESNSVDVCVTTFYYINL